MATGYFDRDDPLIQIGLTGASDHPMRPVVCLVDSGFDGFLLLNEADAPGLELIQVHTGSVEYADSSSAFRGYCVGIAEVDGIQKKGLVALEPGASRTLLGIKFLRAFAMRLTLDPLNNIVGFTSAARNR